MPRTKVEPVVVLTPLKQLKVNVLQAVKPVVESCVLKQLEKSNLADLIKSEAAKLNMKRFSDKTLASVVKSTNAEVPNIVAAKVDAEAKSINKIVSEVVKETPNPPKEKNLLH